MTYYSENDNLSFFSLDKNIYPKNDVHEILNPNFYNIVYKEESIDNQRLYMKVMNDMNENDNNKKKNSYEKSTSSKTNLNYSTRELNFEKEDNINNKDYPKFCSLFEIKELIINKLDISKCNDIIKNIEYNKRVEEGENKLQLIRKKRERPNVEEYDNIYDINPKKDKENYHKRGPKTQKYNYKKEHNKYSPDNIIKGIKSRIFEYPIKFLNNMLEKYKEPNRDLLLKLDYKYINKVNKKFDLEYLNMPLKHLFSNEVSFKVKQKLKDKDYNKNTIERIIQIETDKTVLFALNMKFNDWLDLFTLKKNVIDIVIDYDVDPNDIDYKKIENNLIKVDNLLNIMLDNNKDEYFSLFTLYLFNYKRWFSIKKGRDIIR